MLKHSYLVTLAPTVIQSSRDNQPEEVDETGNGVMGTGTTALDVALNTLVLAGFVATLLGGIYLLQSILAV